MTGMISSPLEPLSAIPIECRLNCNVVMGVVPSYQEHPIRRLIQLLRACSARPVLATL
jgi:hypothetical protein